MRRTTESIIITVPTFDDDVNSNKMFNNYFSAFIIGALVTTSGRTMDSERVSNSSKEYVHKTMICNKNFSSVLYYGVLAGSLTVCLRKSNFKDSQSLFRCFRGREKRF